MYKKEYPPIFTDGFKEIGMWQLDEIFLSPFGENEQRKNLINRLSRYLHELETLNIDIEVWIDGSFSTKKPDPEDVDLVLLVDRSNIESLTEKKADLFEYLVMNREIIRARFNCDIYFIDKHDEEECEKWKKTFGFDSSKINSKGIYILNLKQNV